MVSSSQYLTRMTPEPIIARSTSGRILQKVFDLFLGGIAHHPLDPGPVVPTAVEEHDLTGRRQMREVALDVHLRLLALGRRGQRDHAEDARAGALGDALDDAALAGGIAAFEQHADLGAAGLDPLLHLDQLDLELLQLPLEFLAAQSGRGSGASVVSAATCAAASASASAISSFSLFFFLPLSFAMVTSTITLFTR